MKQFKKNSKIFFVLILFILFSFNSVHAQQKTTYVKRIEQIEKEAAQKLGYSRMNEIVALLIMEGLSDALDGYITKKARVAVWYSEELQKAESLKTAEEIGQEKQKAETEKRKSEETAEKRRKAEEARAAIRRYESSDRGQIENLIKHNFANWQTKGEFEKQADYEERLKTQSLQKFPEICVEAIKYRIINKIYNPFLWHDRIRTKYLVYNSEDEFFDVSFALKNGTEWRSKINIPIENAENLKNKFEYLKVKINDYDWCFVDNSLYPTLVIMYTDNNPQKSLLIPNDSVYKFFSLIESPQKVSFAFNDLDIENEYLKDEVFNLEMLQEMLEEREKRDSLEHANYIEKLDSIFAEYNKQLLQNPYNINEEIMTDYKKMQRDGDREENYEEILKDIGNKFKSINNDFEEQLRKQNPAKYFKIYYSQNPDKKVIADKMYLECRCEYRIRTDFDLYLFRNNWRIGYDCGCREKAYSGRGAANMGVKEHFSSRAEFDTYYDQGEAILNQEVEKRKAKKEVEKLSIKSPTNYSNLFENKEKEDLLRTYLSKNRSKPYYPELIEVALSKNEGLNKEWNKNGQYFQDKTEFYEVYISENYKHILKAKKKKK